MNSNEKEFPELKWLIDFSGMSTCQVLFCAKSFLNHVHCMYVFTFLCGCFFVVFLHGHIEYQYF